MDSVAFGEMSRKLRVCCCCRATIWKTRHRRARLIGRCGTFIARWLLIGHRNGISEFLSEWNFFCRWGNFWISNRGISLRSRVSPTVLQKTTLVIHDGDANSGWSSMTESGQVSSYEITWQMRHGVEVIDYLITIPVAKFTDLKTSTCCAIEGSSSCVSCFKRTTSDST